VNVRDHLIDACRVPRSVAERRVGLWEIRRYDVRKAGGPSWAEFVRLGPYTEVTALLRDTLATLHSDSGECVMEDSPRELQRHLPILLAAHGRVLVSGLGLGCVVRGLLSKPEVEHIDVVEIDTSIIDLVGREFARNPRVELHIGDAETIEWPDKSRWDFAWHDVWSETESLDVVHARMLTRYHDVAEVQGCWQFPRVVKRAWPRRLLGARRRRAA
jgi:hypothetical protein